MPISRTLNYQSATCGVIGTVEMTRFNQTSFPPLCRTATAACGNGNGITGIEEHVYRGTLILPPGCGADWVLSVTLCCRNNSITTIIGTPALYIEATLDNTVIPCNSSPIFTNTPYTVSYSNDSTIYDLGVTEADGDSLVFFLVNALSAASTNVNYVPGHSGSAPLGPGVPVMIDPATGLIQIPSDGFTGIGVFAVLVEEYRNGVKIGETRRDIQFQDCITYTIPTMNEWGLILFSLLLSCLVTVGLFKRQKREVVV